MLNDVRNVPHDIDVRENLKQLQMEENMSVENENILHEKHHRVQHVQHDIKMERHMRIKYHKPHV